jgi:glycosyltransferase involved in cell wall biosynthesis
MPLAKLLSIMTSTKLVFDPLASRYETKILDWRRKSEDSWQARWNFEIDRWAFNLSDLIIADTKAHKDYFCQVYGIKAKKIAVLPVGFDDDLFQPRESRENRIHFSVLFFGSFLPLHGAELIVRAAQIVMQRDRSVKFTFLGSGQTLPRVKALASELECRNVTFKGWIPQAGLPQAISSADLCLGIFGSTEKAQRVVPHKVFQALAMRKAVITARTPAIEEFFSHRQDIFLCSESSADYLAEAVLELKKNETLRENMAEKGYQLVREKYSPRALGRDLLIILKDSSCLN